MLAAINREKSLAAKLRMEGGLRHKEIKSLAI